MKTSNYTPLVSRSTLSRFIALALVLSLGVVQFASALSNPGPSYPNGGPLNTGAVSNPVDPTPINVGGNTPLNPPNGATKPVPSFSAIDTPIITSSNGPVQIVDGLVTKGLVDLQNGMVNQGGSINLYDSVSIGSGAIGETLSVGTDMSVAVGKTLQVLGTSNVKDLTVNGAGTFNNGVSVTNGFNTISLNSTGISKTLGPADFSILNGNGTWSITSTGDVTSNGGLTASKIGVFGTGLQVNQGNLNVASGNITAPFGTITAAGGATIGTGLSVDNFGNLKFTNGQGITLGSGNITLTHGNINVTDGSLTVGNYQSTIQGSLEIDNNGGNVNGALYIFQGGMKIRQGDVVIGNGGGIHNNLTVTLGDATIGGLVTANQLTVSGTTTFNGANMFTVNPPATFADALTLSNAAKNLTVAGPAQFNNNVTIANAKTLTTGAISATTITASGTLSGATIKASGGGKIGSYYRLDAAGTVVDATSGRHEMNLTCGAGSIMVSCQGWAGGDLTTFTVLGSYMTSTSSCKVGYLNKSGGGQSTWTQAMCFDPTGAAGSGTGSYLNVVNNTSRAVTPSVTAY